MKVTYDDEALVRLARMERMILWRESFVATLRAIDPSRPKTRLEEAESTANGAVEAFDKAFVFAGRSA